MENKKDIGKAISDKLSSLDKTPRENVWNGISYELQKKKKRRIAFFFFWTKAIGLLLVGAIAALYVYNQNDGFNTISPKDTNESIIVNGNGSKTNSNNSNEENTEVNNNKSDVNNGIVADDEKSNEKRNAFDKENNLKNSNATDNQNSIDNKNSVNSKSKKGSFKTTRNNNSSSKTSKSSKNTKGTRADGDLTTKTKQSGAKSGQFSKVSAKKSNKKTNGKSKTEKETSSLSDLKTEQSTTALFDPKSLQNNSSIDKTKEVNTKKTDSLIAKKEKKKRIDLKPEEETKKDSTITKDGFVRFHVDAFLSPTYYGYFSDKSTISRFLNSNSKTTEIEMNYGAGLSYDLTERVAIRIAYTKVKLNYITHNALVNTQNYSGIDYNPGVTNESIYTASDSAQTMDITQKMSYNDISLEGRYKFLDKKIGMNAIFGFSFSMLNDNTVSVKTSNGFGQTIGRTKDLFDTAASVNVGFGLDYQVLKNTKLFIEPMFNYQAMSFENSNYKPYYFGLHFGIRYALINK